jgi:hypothetical protein
MYFQRVDHFDCINLGDILIYVGDPEMQENAEQGRVVYKDSVRFEVSWQNDSNDPVTYHIYEDPLTCWELWIVKGE